MTYFSMLNMMSLIVTPPILYAFKVYLSYLKMTNLQLYLLSHASKFALYVCYKSSVKFCLYQLWKFK